MERKGRAERGGGGQQQQQQLQPLNGFCGRIGKLTRQVKNSVCEKPSKYFGKYSYFILFSQSFGSLFQ